MSKEGTRLPREEHQTKEVHDGHRLRVAPNRAWIEVVRGPDAGSRVSISSMWFRIGSDPLADLILTDPTTSRRHCVIRSTSEGFLLQDTGSTNGTFVDELRLGEIYLDDGAIIRAGNSILQFRTDTPPEKTAAPVIAEIIGQSEALQKVIVHVLKVAPTDLSVVIEGETGTGKELVAAAIHKYSKRCDDPFIVFDCGAFPPTLIESELFGHERGAFSGAVGVHKGVFERANGGTIFFDELGEMALEFQSKLLRALESGEVRRVGGERVFHVDVRVIAATNRDLEEMIQAGEFRQDLFYRLAKMRFTLPPIRDRAGDVPLLVQHLLAQFAAAEDSPAPTVTPEGMDVLCAYPWPGNVRELRNILERAAALCEDGRITGVYLRGELGLAARLQAPTGGHPVVGEAAHEDLLPDANEETVPLRDAKERIIADFERRYLIRLLEKHNQNVSRAAREAQVDRRHFYRLLKKYDLMDAK